MADIVTDISVNKNWNARKGANNPVTFTFTQSAAAFNISTYTFSIQIRKFGSDTNLLNLTQGSGITNNGAAGTLNVVITSANLSTFTADDYYWQMTVVHPDTFSYLWFQGTFNLYSETYTGDLTTSINESIDVNGTTVNCAITLGVGDSGDLTNGNGTTANGTAVDLGGVVSSPVVFTGTSSMQIGDDSVPLSAIFGNGGIDTSLGQTYFEYSSTGNYIRVSKLFGTYVVLNKSIGHYQKNTSNDWGFHYSFQRGGDAEKLMLSFVPTSSTTWDTILNLGSDATGDQYHRNSLGYLVRRGTVSAASTSSLTINSDTTYQYSLTALAASLSIEAPTGTPFNGQDLLIRIKDNATARALTWNAIFRVIGVTLPTTTVISKTMYIACIYNSTDTKWDVIGVREEE